MSTPLLPIDSATLRHAGRSRYRTSLELADYVRSLSATEFGCLKDIIERELPPMAGGSQQSLVSVAAPAALGAGQATYMGPLLGIPQSPLVLGLHYAPTIAGATAAATITLQMRRTDTPAVISNAVKLTATADTQPGPWMLMGIVPTGLAGVPAGFGIDMQGAASAGAGTFTASATAPLILAALGLN